MIYTNVYLTILDLNQAKVLRVGLRLVLDVTAVGVSSLSRKLDNSSESKVVYLSTYAEEVELIKEISRVINFRNLIRLGSAGIGS